MKTPELFGVGVFGICSECPKHPGHPWYPGHLESLGLGARENSGALSGALAVAWEQAVGP